MPCPEVFVPPAEDASAQCRSPLDCWAERSERVRELPPGTDLLRLCMRRHRRRVLKDRTLHFRGRLYETTEPLGGRTVTLFEDPDAPPERPIEIECDGDPASAADSPEEND